MSDSAEMQQPELLLKSMNKLNGYHPQLIIPKKTLFKCDLDDKQSRLQVSSMHMENSGFLTEDEKRTIEAQKMKKRRTAGLRVAFIDPESQQYVLELHKWTKSYAFVKGWNKVVDKNDKTFKVGDVFSLWVFRCGGVNPVHDGVNLSGGHADSVVDGLEQGSLCFVLVPAKVSVHDGNLPQDSGHDGHNDNLPQDSVEPSSFFDESYELNHLFFDQEDSQGYLPDEDEDFGFNDDGSIRDSGHYQ
ncbi:putative B3 domain-containing protein [Arabidopsis thaliana]|uniref:Putative B3 domain-containing protein At2g31460 n=4 Tax=Arabidopsis TaxID=3701 RepID=Y2146_ARATH|nr:B3 domain protein, putative (DUF313) [Arabidopsis thaliana]Q9SIC3.1 RecName: Full=Putative B3 domain-containing protein At2g31460 [Arabidopsis thaliana]KAG7638104.1 DNA-binding pseudobarrel domain superfamily [Arabidopsis thaliana x Arabidopsis arenosa]KAG7642727.1 DNA-binding pseudobarrel domain superfamily [Arabidopsis suecica]AAD26473.1 hypothetical protein [Arabidopsis thaliana]ABE65464.1 hypothetical protein At2g31460 [Arabidopsis thaliana]AEC08551.1 B3 domain protein, putative (DUF31|eukprot:NP_180704.1 B3 domain protein, putative (DUF313) [Arabidopsis thaliana]